MPARDHAAEFLPTPRHDLVGTAVFILTSALYAVSEIEQVIITQFGRPVGAAVTTAGLKLRARPGGCRTAAAGWQFVSGMEEMPDVDCGTAAGA
jgi:hypothetical protein